VKDRLAIGTVIDWFCGAVIGVSHCQVQITSPVVPAAAVTSAPNVVAEPDPLDAVNGPKVTRLLLEIELIPLELVAELNVTI
jgi:hypothetical protein